MGKHDIYDYSRLDNKRLLSSFAYWNNKIKQQEYKTGGRIPRYHESKMKRAFLHEEIKKRKLTPPKTRPVYGGW